MFHVYLETEQCHCNWAKAASATKVPSWSACRLHSLRIFEPKSRSVSTVSAIQIDSKCHCLMVFKYFLLNYRCNRVFTEEPKRVPASAIQTPTQSKAKTITTTTTPKLALIDKHKKETLEQIQKKFQLTEGLK